MHSNQPTAAQTRWRESVRELGSVISGGPAVIHHCVGRTAKHDKVHIGHCWILPLTDSEHKALHSGHLDWLLCETEWEGMSRKFFEKHAFKFSVVDRLDVPDEYTFDVNHAIQGYHR